MQRFIEVLFLTFIGIRTVAAATDERWNATLHRYNSSDKPRLNTRVTVNLYLQDLRNINSHDQTFQVQLMLRQIWTEPRLSHKHDGNMPYQTVDPSLIWTPDTFFPNELESQEHAVTRKNTFLRIKRNGEILLSERLTMKLSCPMNLAAFPFDMQVCTLYINSYGYVRSMVYYEWKEHQPIQMNKQQLPLDFELRHYNTSLCTARMNTGDYSCIKVEFFLHRRWTYYMRHVFIPLIMLNVIAWLTFWVRDVPIRITMLMFTLFLTSFNITTTSQELPPTPYVKMIDYFTGTCFVFVFAAIIEFVIVKWREEKQEKDEENSGNKIDVACRLVYPIAYAAFIVVYSIAGLLA